MLKTIIRLPDGIEISSGSNAINAIQNVTLTECVNSGEDLTIGSTCANALEATLITPEGALSIPAGTRVAVLKQEGDKAPVQIGVFNLEKPTRPTANTMKLAGYDRVAELDKDLTDWLNNLYVKEEWEYTLTEFASMVCAACGLAFNEADVPNADFAVPRFVRSAVTGRQLMQWLGEICCRFCRADAKGNIEFAWYQPSGKTITHTGERYYLQNGLTYEDYKTAKIEAVQLRLANSADGALWPSAAEGVNSYIITDNAILNAQIGEHLRPYLQLIRDELAKVEYTPCKVTIPACLDIRAGGIVDVIDKNGASMTALVMTKTQTGQQDTLECTGNSRRDTPTAANNQPKPATAAAQDAFAGMTQAQVFNKLTDNGKIQGLYAQDGKWYINAELAQVINLVATNIVTGILESKDPQKNFYLDLDNGILKMNAKEFSVSGQTVDQIADDAAAAAKNDAMTYAAETAASAVNSQTQEDIFNKLFANGKVQGFVIKDNMLYINGEYAEITGLKADEIVSGVLSSQNGKTYFNLDTGEITSVSDNGTKVVVSNGMIAVYNSSGIQRVGIDRLGDDQHYIVSLRDNNGEYAGGIGVFGNDFGVFASDGQSVVGKPTVWKTIGGETYLVAK